MTGTFPTKCEPLGGASHQAETKEKFSLLNKFHAASIRQKSRSWLDFRILHVELDIENYEKLFNALLYEVTNFIFHMHITHIYTVIL